MIIRKASLAGMAAIMVTSLLFGLVQAGAGFDPTMFGIEEDPIRWEETDSYFSHQNHIEGFGLGCDACHSDIFEMEKGAALQAGDFTMQSFAEGKYCGSCHDGRSAFDASTRCGSCHFPPEETIIFTYPVKAVVFSHDLHTSEGKISCETCHQEVFVMEKGALEDKEMAYSPDPQEKREYLEALHNNYCGTCHDSGQAFGYVTRCTVCHVGVSGYESFEGPSVDKGK